MNTTKTDADKQTEPVDRSKGKWYVLQTGTGRENKVKEALESKLMQAPGAVPVYEVLIPVHKYIDPKTQHTVVRKIHPNYVFVRMDLYEEDGKTRNEAAWYFVRGVAGVTRFVGDPEHPQPISDEEVQDLLHTVDTLKDGATLPPPPPWLVVGTRVRVEDRDCVFNGSDGKIIEIDPEHAKLKLMISIFERDTPVELEFGQVGPCED